MATHDHLKVGRSTIFFLVVVLAVFAFAPKKITAQWKQIGAFGSPVTCSYFYDGIPGARFGFVATEDGSLWRTDDSGKTWTQVRQPGLGSRAVADICFKDSLVGWFSLEILDANNIQACYETIDGGATWFPLSPVGIFDAVHYVGSTHLLLFDAWFQGILISSDEGLTWSVASDNGLGGDGFAFSTKFHGIHNSTTHWMSTRDGGATWTSMPSIGETQQPFGVEGTDIYFSALDGPGFAFGGDVYRSDDVGTSWNKVGHIPTSDTSAGCIRGSICEMFAQSSAGMYLSQDQGVNWRLIGGPPMLLHYFNMRFYAHDGVIVAGDRDGNVYRLDTTFYVKPPASLTAITPQLSFGSLNACGVSFADSTIVFRNDYSCDDVTITKIEILSTDSKFSITTIPTLPRVFTPHDSDSVRIHFNPKSLGPSNGKLHIIVTLGKNTKDLYIPLSGSLTETASASLSVAQLQYDTVSTCDTLSEFAYLKNTVCDSLLISDYAPLSNGAFSLLSPTKDTMLLSGDSLAVRIRFAPSTSAVQHDSVTFLCKLANGSSRLVTLRVEGVGDPGAAGISIPTDTLDFGQVSTCASVTGTAYFTSTGCDSLRVSGEALQGSSAFTVLNAHSGSLAVGANDSVLIHFAPPSVGAFSDTLTLTTNAGIKRVYVKGSGVTGGGSVSLSALSIKFDTATASCDSSTASFRFTNSTCYTVTVDSVSAVAPSFYVGGIPATTLPVDSSLTFGMSFIPTTVGHHTGSVLVYYHGPDNIERDTTVTLTATAITSPTIGIAMAQAAYSAAVLGTIDIPFYLTGNLDAQSSQVIGLQSLTIDLSMNTDLLTPLQAIPEIPNISQIPVQTIGKGAISLPIMLPANFTFKDSTLLMTLHCQAFITDTMGTSITMTGATFSSQNAKACFAQIVTSTSSTFQLIAGCEDSLLTSTLAHGLAFTVQSIVPNPTDGNLTVTLMQNKNEVIQYELCDVLGRVVKNGHLNAGQARLDAAILSSQKAEEFDLDFRGAESGSYYLRLSGSDEVVSRKIVLRR